MSRRSAQRTFDILSAIQRINRYRSALVGNDRTVSEMALEAILRNLAVIGEAAKSIPASMKDTTPLIPWKSIIGLRNIVIHEYFDIRTELILDIVDNHLSALDSALRKFITLRPMALIDRPLRDRSVLQNVNWREDRFTLEDVQERPEFRRYSEWDDRKDFGFVAEFYAEEDLGTVWVRHLTRSSAGYGYLSEGIPELSITVWKSYRGVRLGSILLEALLSEARKRHVEAISLSVEDANPAVNLYEKFGFAGAKDIGQSTTPTTTWIKRLTTHDCKS